MSNTIHKEVTFQSMFMYSDYILQNTHRSRSSGGWCMAKLPLLKWLFHYSGNGRTGFPGASGSIAHLPFCEHMNSCFTLMSTYLSGCSWKLFLSSEGCGWWLLLIYYQYLSSVYHLFHLHFSQIDLICDSSEIHCVVIMRCKTSVLYADV